jgi:hypothetical protein
MNVKENRSVEFALGTLAPAERQKALAWLDHLANWENDPQTRAASKPSNYRNVQVLTTSDDISISFSLDSENSEITVLDITKPSRFATANHSPE